MLQWAQQAWNTQFPVWEGAVGRSDGLSLPFIIRTHAGKFKGVYQAVYASLYAPWRILGNSDLPVARAGQGPLRGGTRSG